MRESNINKYSDDEFRSIVNSSYSIAEVTKKCGYKTFRSGGGRQRVIQRIRNLDICTNHFKPTGRQYEKPPHNKILDYSSVLSKKSYAHRVTIKDIVLRESIIEYECAICGNNGIWNNKQLSLQLHHKDGDATNNEIENLQFLCPNCHSQTDNYGYKNAERAPRKKYYCSLCGKEITKDSRTGKCKVCAAKSNIKNIPTKVELIEVAKGELFKKSICYHFGVSDRLLDKWLESYGLPKHISELHQFITDNNL